MKKYLINFLLLLMMVFLMVPSVFAQDIEEEVVPEEPEIVIEIKNEKKLHKLDLYDTEIIQFDVALEEDYSVSVVSAPDDILDITVGEKEFTVNAKKVGNTKVTLIVRLKDEDKSYTHEFNFQVQEEKGYLKFNQDSFYLIRGLTFVVDFEVEPKNLDLGRIVWSSSTPSVASVENGKVYGHKLGQTVISASLDGHTESMIVHVSAPLTKIEFNPSSVNLNLNETAKIPELIYVPYDTTSDKTATYHIVDESIVVIESGVLRGLKVGETQLEAEVAGIKTTLDIKVSEKVSNREAETYLLENTKNDDTGFYLQVRDFKPSNLKSFELVLPDQEILDYMENREHSTLWIQLPDELLKEDLSNLSSMLINKEILLQLGAQKLEVIFGDLNGKILYKFFINQRIKNDYNLSFNFRNIKLQDPLYQLVKNDRAFKLNFTEKPVDGMRVYINHKLFGSEVNQYHFIYGYNQDLIIDSEQKLMANDDGFIEFVPTHQENIVSLTPITNVNNTWIIVTFSMIIAMIVGFVLYKNIKRLRNAR